MSDRWQKLRELADAATPGEWYAADWQQDQGDDKTTIEYRSPEVLYPGQSSIWPGGVAKHRIAETSEGDKPHEDAAYIAAANPSTVTALLAERDQLLAALRDCVDSLKYVQDLPPGRYEAPITGYGVRAERIAAAERLAGDKTE